MGNASFKGALALATDIRSRRIGCLELLDYFWERTQRFNPKLNAIVVEDLDRARTRARAADAAIGRGEIWGPLHGLPISVKESFDIVGLPTTWGIPELKDNCPSTNALAVDRLLDAGAIIFAKTNVPTLLADWQTFNPIYGTTNNPWNPSLSPGGSSGGSAAALAAGLTSLECGSDIGGSIRNPAHYCGVYGHKCSYGIIPMKGQLYPGNVASVDFFVTGPMARSAADLDAALRILAGPDPHEGVGWQLRLPPPRHTKLSEYRIALILNDANSHVDRQVQDQLSALAEHLARSGATISELARPDLDLMELNELYVYLLRAATSRTQTLAAFEHNLQTARSLDQDDRSYFAKMVRGNTLYHKDWLELDERRHRIRRNWANFFRNYDVLLCPAAASAAQPHDQLGERFRRSILVDGTKVPATDQLFWAGIATLAGLPASVAPIGLTPSGLPVGVQVIAAGYHDFTCISFAELLEREYYAFVPPPGYAE
jgi:amidase